MSIITIITHPPKSGNAGRSAESSQEFDTVEAAVAYLQSLPPTDELPAGDGSSES